MAFAIETPPSFDNEGVDYNWPPSKQQRHLKYGQALKWVLMLTFFALWEILPRLRIVNPIFIPPLSEVVIKLINLFNSGEIWNHLFSSYQRLAIAYFIGVSLGLYIAILAVYSRLVSPVYLMMMATLFSIPKIALLPVFILWFGIGEFTKILPVAMGVFFLSSITAYTGLRKTVPQEIVDAARVDGASNFMIITKIALPAASPVIFNGFKVSVVYAFPTVLTTEMLIANQGLGFLLMNSMQIMATDQLFAVLIITVLGSLVLFRALSLLERLLIR